MASGPSGEDLLCDPPNVEDVSMVLYSVVDWYTVGLKLGVPTDELDEIRCAGRPKEQKKALARAWLEEKQGKSPSWLHLRTILSEMKMVKAVEIIDKRFRPGFNQVSPSLPKLDSRPTMTQLHVIVGTNGQRYKIIEELAGQWKELADFLLEKLSPSISREIEKDARLPTLSDKCRAVFERWLDGGASTRQPVTWDELLTVLGDLEKSTLASDLKNHAFQQE